MMFFCMSFCIPFFYRFLVQLGSNLAPNLAPKSTKNRSKSHPNSILTCILFSIAFWIDFGRNFHRFSILKSTKNQPKFNKKSTQHHNNQKTKKFIITRQGRWIRALGHVRLATKMYKNPYNNLQKTGLESTPQLGSILWPTWPHFGRVLGVKMGPSWHKSLQKWLSKSIQKMITFWIALGTDFDRFGAPTWLPRGGPRNFCSMFFLLLSQSWGQDGPKTPQEPPKSRFWLILIFCPILSAFE